MNPAPCVNFKCISNDSSESGCNMFPIHTVDLCEHYVAPAAITSLKKEIERLQAENKLLRHHNRNLVKTGHKLRRKNKELRKMIKKALLLT